MDNNDNNRRISEDYHGAVSLGLPIRKVISTLVGNRKEPIILSIKENWEDIIGKEYYLYCQPEKIVFPKGKGANGTLYIKIFNPSLTLYIDANELYIIEKISTYFGYKVVSKIKIHQEPTAMSNTTKTIKVPKLKEEDREYIEKTIRKIKGEELQKSLFNLGREVFVEK